ncbi:MAG: type II toxin-antitoxin system death-on-curing family toxin [Succinivibrionaceae bacterium]|nr:type II toxin-antitoxin system death-on-curing family toxin [Succinivibrionaceae bacterium]
MIVLSHSQVLILHEQLIRQYGGSHGLRDGGLLDSALQGPFQTFGGIDLYPSILEKAARLAYSLVTNHPFVDGNKRIGAHAMIMFLYLNGVDLSFTQKELIDLFLSLAAGNTDANELHRWLQAHVV